MRDRPHNAPVDFDLTGDNADATTSALSADTPAQGDAPTPRLREHRSGDGHPGGDRSPDEVIESHLWQGRHGSVDDDLAQNFHPDVVMLTRWGVHHGHDGMRALAHKLKEELPGADFTYDEVLIEGDVGYLEWRAQASDGSHVCDGADSYVVRDGKIAAQTIHYIVQGPHGRPAAEPLSEPRSGDPAAEAAGQEERWVAHRREGWTVERPGQGEPVSVHDDFDDARTALNDRDGGAADEP